MMLPGRTKSMGTLLCAATLLASPLAAPGADVTLAHSALERLIWRTVLIEGGRAYLEGSSTDDCRYAFVQEPRVSGKDGRLQARFVFSGRAGASLGERCVGPGDTFDIVVSGIPALASGVLYLDELQVEAPDTAYFRLVRGLVERELGARLRYSLKDDLNDVAAAAGAAAGYAVSLTSLELDEVQVDEAAVRLLLRTVLDFR